MQSESSGPPFHTAQLEQAAKFQSHRADSEQLTDHREVGRKEQGRRCCERRRRRGRPRGALVRTGCILLEGKSRSRSRGVRVDQELSRASWTFAEGDGTRQKVVVSFEAPCAKCQKSPAVICRLHARSRCGSDQLRPVWAHQQRALNPARPGREQRYRKASVMGPFLFGSEAARSSVSRGPLLPHSIS